MRTFKLILAYDGTDFAGWQWQPRQRTVQGELQKALQGITQEKIHCTSSGRTDAGVHALGQVVSFDSETYLSPAALAKALNAELPEDMLVFEVVQAPLGFHAREHAIRKRYRYVIQDGRLPDLFNRKYVWHVYRRLDVDAMREAARSLVGTHDFASYESSGSRRLSTERTVHDLLIERRQAELTDRVVIEVEADGFLYNMVRNIAGTLVAVGKGQEPVSFPADALAKKDRRAAGMTAPAQGLFLVGVEYGTEELRIADCGLRIDDDDSGVE
ncbi:MAG TPA: tRNA pseudouridine(38-40) synthase TruA [Pirellulaceae bacterium]|nr:tRNA pseudouridine(38-40) synthase TruA [Pirellulaceae bacterium]